MGRSARACGTLECHALAGGFGGGSEGYFSCHKRQPQGGLRSDRFSLAGVGDRTGVLNKIRYGVGGDKMCLMVR